MRKSLPESVTSLRKWVTRRHCVNEIFLGNRRRTKSTKQIFTTIDVRKRKW